MFSLVSRVMVSGMVPVRGMLYSCSCTMFVSAPIVLGIVPDISALLYSDSSLGATSSKEGTRKGMDA